MAETVCAYNGCKLTAEEIKEPYICDGEVFCEDCDESWRMDNESACPFCGDYFLDDGLSACFVVIDVDVMEPGLYRPLKYPYYDAPMIGRSSFRDGAVDRIGSLLHPEWIEPNPPCAYVCKQCMGEEGPFWNPMTERWDGQEEPTDGDTVH